MEPIFQTVTALPDPEQGQIGAECQDVKGIAYQGRVMALTDQADFHGHKALPLTDPKIRGFDGAAMWACIDHLLYRAYCFYCHARAFLA